MPITMGWVLRQDNDPDGARAFLDRMGDPRPEPEARYRRDGLHKVAQHQG